MTNEMNKANTLKSGDIVMVEKGIFRRKNYGCCILTFVGMSKTGNYICSTSSGNIEVQEVSFYR